MPTKQGQFFGQYSLIACDGRCDKAWGINGRPQLYFMGDAEPRALREGEEPLNEDDHVYVKDSELGTAPGPGETRTVSEGGHLKPSATPLTDARLTNKWCARECERSECFKDGEQVVLRDLERPEPNVPKVAVESGESRGR
jgi:hypothetical protein